MNLKVFLLKSFNAFFFSRTAFIAAFSCVGRLFKNIYRNELLTDLDNVSLIEMVKVPSTALATCFIKTFLATLVSKLHYKKPQGNKSGEKVDSLRYVYFTNPWNSTWPGTTRVTTA